MESRFCQPGTMQCAADAMTMLCESNPVMGVTAAACARLCIAKAVLEPVLSSATEEDIDSDESELHALLEDMASVLADIDVLIHSLSAPGRSRFGL